MEIEQVRYCK